MHFVYIVPMKVTHTHIHIYTIFFPVCTLQNMVAYVVKMCTCSLLTVKMFQSTRECGQRLRTKLCGHMYMRNAISCINEVVTITLLEHRQTELTRKAACQIETWNTEWIIPCVFRCGKILLKWTSWVTFPLFWNTFQFKRRLVNGLWGRPLWFSALQLLL